MPVSERDISRAELLREFHTIAGTAGTFGYADIAALAWEAECILSSASEPEVTPDEVEHVAARLAALDQAVHQYLQYDGSPDTVWSTFEGGGVV